MPKRNRRVFSAAEKLRIVNAADACLASGKRGALKALLRSEGIYNSHLASWRLQLSAGATDGPAKKAGRKPRLTETQRLAAKVEQRTAAQEKHDRIASALAALKARASAVPGTVTQRERRSLLLDLVDELMEPGVSVVAACAAIGVSRATLYRAKATAAPDACEDGAPSADPPSPEEDAADP